MAIWEIRTWFAQCVRCRFRAHQEGRTRKDFIHNLRSEGWYIHDRKTLCPRCREAQRLPAQEVSAR